jgi:hypothetical protein
VSEWLVNEDGDITGEVPDTKGPMILGTEEIRSVRILSGASDE